MPNWDFRTNRWRDDSGRFISAERAGELNDVWDRLDQTVNRINNLIDPITSVPVSGLPTSSFPVPIHQTQGLPILPNVPMGSFPTPVQPPAFFPQPGVFSRGEDTYQFRGYGDTQFINNIMNQGGAFAATASINPQGQITSAMENARAAAASNNPVAALQAQGAPYVGWGGISPQNLAKVTSMIALPQGTQYWNQIQPILETLRQQPGYENYVYRGGSHLFDAGALARSSFPMDAQGNVYGFSTTKVGQTAGVHETLPFGPAPGQSSLGFTSPLVAPSPLQGNLAQHAFFLRPHLLFPEGQGFARSDMGVIERGFRRQVGVPEGGFGFAPGDVFGYGQDPRTFAEGDTYRGSNFKGIPGLIGTGGNYAGGRISSIEYLEGGQAVVTGSQFLNVAGQASSKLHEKINLAPVNPSWFNRFEGADLSNVQIASALPGPKYFPSFAANLYQANTPAEQIQKQFPQGLLPDNLSAEQAQFFTRWGEQFVRENMQVVTRRGVAMHQQIYEMYKDVQTAGAPAVTITGQGAGGTLMTDVRDYALLANKIDRYRPEQMGSMRPISSEEMNQMAQFNRGFYDYFTGLESRGALPNAARETISATRANLNAQYRAQQSIINAEQLDIAGARDRARQVVGGEGVSDALRVEMVRQLAKTSGNQMVSVGDTVLTSPRSAARHITFDENGQPINNYAMRYADALLAAQEYKDTAAINLPENMGAVSELRAQAAGAAFESMKEMAGRARTQQQALGIETRALSGPAQGIPGLPENEVVVRSRDLFRMTGARTRAEREQIVQLAKSGELTGLVQMWPHTDPAEHYPSVRVRLEEQVRRRQGMQDLAVSEGNFGMSPIMAAMLEKDEDADPAALHIGARFVDGELVTAGGKAWSARRVRQTAERDYRLELQGMRDKAAISSDLDTYFGEVQKYVGGRSMSDIVAEYDRGAESKARMGQLYNWSVRDQFNFGSTLLGRSNLSPQARELSQRAMSQLAKAPYQPALDLKATEMGQLEEMSRFLSFDSSKMPGKRAPWFGGTNARQMDATTLPEIASEVIRAHANFGRDDENWREMILPSQARAMLPAEYAGDEERFGQMMTALGRDNVDVNEIVSAMGRADPVHAVFGSQHDPRLETLSPWMASTLGAMTQRASTRGGAAKFLKPELMQGLSGTVMQIMQGVRSAKSIFQLKRGKTPGVESLLATGEQLPAETFEYTKAAMQQMGADYPIDAPQQTLPEVQAQINEQFVPPTESAAPNYLKGRINAAEEVIKRRERFARTAQDPELRMQHEQRLKLHRQRVTSYISQNSPPVGSGLEGIFGGGGGGGPVDPAGVAMPDDMPERGGTYIGTQNINQAPIKIRPNAITPAQVGEARESFRIISQLSDHFEKLVKSSGALSDEQTKLLKNFVSHSETLSKVTKQYEMLSTTPGIQTSKEMEAIRGLMETPGFFGASERGKGLAYLGQRRLDREAFQQIFMAGTSPEQQPDVDQLWDILGGVGKGAEKARNRAFQKGWFDDFEDPIGLGLQGKGVARAMRPLANLRGLFADETGHRLTGMMWRGSMLLGLGLGPALRGAQDYMGASIAQDSMLFQSGLSSYGDLMSGTLGDIRQAQATREAGHLAYGRQVYNAYGGFMNMALSPGGSIAGAALGIGQPAGVAGALANMLVPGAGLAVGAGVAAIGAAGYLQSASQNVLGQGAAINQFGRTGLGAIATNFEGTAGLTTNMMALGWNKVWNPSAVDSNQINQLRNARGMASIVDDWASGRNYTTQQLTELGRFGGFSSAQVLGAGLESFYNQASARGISREALAPNLGMWMTYNNMMPNADQVSQMDALTLAGVDLGGLTMSYAGARGISPFNRQGIGNAMSSLMNRVAGAENPLMLAQQIQQASQLAQSVRPQFMMAGLQMGDTRQIEQLLAQNPDFGFAYQEFAQQYSGLMQSNNALGRRTQGGFIGAATRGLLSGDYVGMGEAFKNWGMGMSFGSNVMNYGASMDQAAAVTNAFGGLSTSQRNLAGAILSGDRLAISRFGAATGNQRLQILDPTTGLGALEQNISASEAAMLRADDPYNLLGQVSDAQLAGGTRGLVNDLRLQNRAQRYYGRAVDMWQRQVSAGFQQGSFFEAAQVFQRFGMQLNVGTGQGYWDIEDAQRALNRQQEAYNVQQSGQSINIQEAQFALAGRQFNEQWNLNRRQFNLQSGYQWNQMQRGFARQEVEWGWQREDMAFSRNQDEMQYGWQMEDFDRNIRFARGRERLDLLRQRNRAVITQSMEMMQRQRTEDRFENTVEYQKENNKLQEEYFKENKKLQIEAQDMNKRHFEERRALERQRMDMTKEQHEKQKEWMTERWRLEDQRVLLDRQNIELQRKIAEEVAAKTAEWQEKTIALQEAMQGIGTYFSDWSVELSNIAANAPKILQILKEIRNLGSLANGNITIQTSSGSVNLNQALNNAYALPQGPG